MSDESVLVSERNGAVALLQLNISERLNPLTLPLQRALRAALAELREDRSVRALLITGTGKAFCVGADLSSMSPPENGSLGEQTADVMEHLSNRLIEDLRALPFPVVSAVNGACAGAGVGVALAADVVLAIVPDLGTTWFLERSVGRARAVAMSLLGERLGAEQAVQWGLVWQCVDDDDLSQQALVVAQRLAALPAHAAQEIRAVYELAGRQTLIEQMRSEAGRQCELIDRPTFTEGVQAFLGKRQPVFPPR
ncbi:MAG: enoyl-CoA hydratase-related protein [Rhodanobacter sp.]